MLAEKVGVGLLLYSENFGPVEVRSPRHDQCHNVMFRKKRASGERKKASERGRNGKDQKWE